MKETIIAFTILISLLVLASFTNGWELLIAIPIYFAGFLTGLGEYKEYDDGKWK